jgi:MarR family 2-MHQ and catechol resistance regulon transcriptional repressor
MEINVRLSRPTAESPATAQDEKIRGIVEGYSKAYPHVDEQALVSHILTAYVGNMLTSGLVRQLAGAGFEITRPRFTLLRMLYLSPEHRLPQSEIAQSMRVSGANVTQLIDALEREGWVERLINPADKRVTFAQLTPDGEERCSRLLPAMIEFMEGSMSGLTIEELSLLEGLLAKLRYSVESRYFNDD